MYAIPEQNNGKKAGPSPTPRRRNTISGGPPPCLQKTGLY